MMFWNGGGWAWWQAGLMWAGMIAFWALLIWAVFAVVKNIATRDAGQPLVQDAPRIVAAGLALPGSGAGPPGEAGDQSVDRPDQKTPEHDHAGPHQARLPPGPAAAVPEHHHDHLLAGARSAQAVFPHSRVKRAYLWGVVP